jgi:hypothetical protein
MTDIIPVSNNSNPQKNQRSKVQFEAGNEAFLTPSLFIIGTVTWEFGRGICIVVEFANGMKNRSVEIVKQNVPKSTEISIKW